MTTLARTTYTTNQVAELAEAYPLPNNQVEAANALAIVDWARSVGAAPHVFQEHVMAHALQLAHIRLELLQHRATKVAAGWRIERM